MNKILIIIVCSIIFFLKSKKAYAYIDPGTGSFFLQLLVAGLLGGIFTFKKFFKKIFPEKSKDKISSTNENVDAEDIVSRRSKGS